ncbi:MAG: CHAT domain-containing protein [Acidobacteria bacterium]|nr:CHAT domain-containing protein [Acidobacteriota bacterium]
MPSLRIFIALLLCCSRLIFAQTDEAIARAIAADRAFQQAEQRYKQGELRDALEQFKTSLQLRQPLNDKRGEALTFDLIATIHNQLGEKLQAIEAFQQALARRKESPRDEAATLHNIGVLFSELGDKQQALQHFERALGLWRRAQDQSGLATTLNALGALYSWAGQKEEALQNYQEALPLKRALNDRNGEAYIRNNLGALWSALGEKRKARESFLLALSLWRVLGDRKGQSLALTNLGVVFAELGERQKAIEYLQQALNLQVTLADKYSESRTRGNLGFVYALLHDKVRAAESLNQSLAEARASNNLDAEAATLHHLMLAEKEFNQPARAITFGKLALNAYQQFRANLRDANPQMQQSFVRSKADAYRTLAELLVDAGRLIEAQQVLRLLKAEEFFEFVRGDEPKAATSRLALTAEEQEIAKGYLPRTATTSETGNFVADLATLAPGTAAIFTIMGEDKYRVLLFTGETHLARESSINATDLNRKIHAFRDALNARRPDFMPLSRELYRILIEPIRQDLANAKATTLLWSLDGALRYVPMAALHDGEKYLVARYANAVLTLSSRQNAAPCQNWRGLGLGMSKGVAGLPPLSYVPAELASIIRTSTNGNGVLDGRILLNEAFTEAAMKTELSQRYPAVHIASHFNLAPGNETESYLLLGDGTRLTLAELKHWPRAFDGVELLTLSACETGVGDGREVESLGELAQRLGAKSVLATLLRVPDQSTARLMQQFYRLQSKMSKAEALRQAQLELLRTDSYKHPIYWSPFILMGWD